MGQTLKQQTKLLNYKNEITVDLINFSNLKRKTLWYSIGLVISSIEGKNWQGILVHSVSVLLDCKSYVLKLCDI
jgi:hypothetical protein